MIAPSILNANLLNLNDQVKEVLNAGIKRLHIDIMDAHFVPNLSFGPELVNDLSKAFPAAEIEIHLMSDRPQVLIPVFLKAGADLVELHYEAMQAPALHHWLAYLHAHQIKAGLALSPETPVRVLRDFAHEADQVLLMTVHPGFGGQSFLPSSPERIKEAARLLQAKEKHLPIEVDGGINEQTLPLAQKAGAQIFVAGSFIFKKGKIADQIQLLRREDK